MVHLRRVDVADDLTVFTSRVWQTNCTLIRSGRAAVVIDALPFPDELRHFATLVGQEDVEVETVLVTQSDWDHVVAGSAFPSRPVSCSQAMADQVARGLAGAAMQMFDLTHYIDRPPLRAPRTTVVEVPGALAVGNREIELVP